MASSRPKAAERYGFHRILRRSAETGRVVESREVYDEASPHLARARADETGLLTVIFVEGAEPATNRPPRQGPGGRRVSLVEVSE